VQRTYNAVLYLDAFAVYGLNMRSWPIRLVFLYALILAFVRALLHAHMADIEFNDESGYLWAGLNFFHSGPPAAENSPLYALWYWLESCFIGDPVILYQANWGILLFATLIMFLAALRTAGVSIIGIGLVLSYASVAYYSDVWPYVTALSSALALLAATVSLRAGSPARAYSVAAAVLAVAVFVRPELLLSFLFLLAVAGYFAYREREEWSLILPVIVLGTLWVTFGAPFGGGRSMLAFGQHYAMNVAQARHLDIDFWNNWQQFVRADFGEASTPLHALVANPRAFLWHLTMNANNLLRAPFILIAPLPPLGIAARIAAGAFVAILLAVGAIRGVVHAKRDEKGRRLVIMLVALFVPCLISALLIAPRLHYFMAPLAILCVLAGYGLSRTHFNFPVWVLCFTPLPLIFMALAWNQATPKAPNLATIRVLRALAVPPHGSILEPDFGRGIYANLDYTRLSQMNCNPFDECLRSRRPQIIVSDERLRAHYAKDNGFLALTEHPANYGFDVTHVPDTKVYIYVSHQ
jgi:hypothetical protein